KFKTIMMLRGADDATLCKCFQVTLSMSAMDWYKSVPPNLISNFGEHSLAFVNQFIAIHPALGLNPKSRGIPPKLLG
ncbi:hypothetical protein, partial [Escherichia coli]|uniref:hypothetical protein n=1 Tax=Escherichia coli TaxID=562 RepID=UPI003F44E953